MAIPGIRGTDHIGFTVPDLDEAESFLVGILGATRVYTLGVKRADNDWMTRQIGVHPRTVISEIRFYRLANGSNLEVFQYESADGQAPQPRNSDIGGHHLALYVDDMDSAVAYLREHRVEVMGDPVDSAGASAGQRWIYFRAPWGMQFELVSYPNGKIYETDPTYQDSPGSMLWHPLHPAE